MRRTTEPPPPGDPPHRTTASRAAVLEAVPQIAEPPAAVPAAWGPRQRAHRERAAPDAGHGDRLQRALHARLDGEVADDCAEQRRRHQQTPLQHAQRRHAGRRHREQPRVEHRRRAEHQREDDEQPDARDRVTAALPVAALTAFRALTVKADLKAGERLLITGVGGGVATFALLFGRAIGAEVFVTSGSDETLAAARALGARGLFNYRDEGWGKALRAMAGAVDVVFDGAPAAAFPGYVRCLATGGRVVLYSSTGGPAFAASAPELFLRHAAILGTAMGSPRDFEAMLAFVTAHRLEPVIDMVFAFDQAREALLHLDEGHRFGKVVIEI